MTQVFLVTGSSRGLGREIVEAALAAGHQRGGDRPEGRATRRPRRHLRRPGARRRTRRHRSRSRRRRGPHRGRRVRPARRRGQQRRLRRPRRHRGHHASTTSARRSRPTSSGSSPSPRRRCRCCAQQGSGHIIQVSSVGGRMASVGLGAYQSAKWAVGGFSSVLSQEVAPLGIKVTVLEPGGMRTDWAGSSMAIPAVSAPYEPTVGERARMIRAGLSTEAGDPAQGGPSRPRRRRDGGAAAATAARQRRLPLRHRGRTCARRIRRVMARTQHLHRPRRSHRSAVGPAWP